MMGRVVKEIHVYLDQDSIAKSPFNVYTTLLDTTDAFKYVHPLDGQIHTTILKFLNFKHGKRLFVHVSGEIHEITPEDCKKANVDNAARLVNHSIENLLISGSFEWFKGINDYYTELEGE